MIKRCYTKYSTLIRSSDYCSSDQFCVHFRPHVVFWKLTICVFLSGLNNLPRLRLGSLGEALALTEFLLTTCYMRSNNRPELFAHAFSILDCGFLVQNSIH